MVLKHGRTDSTMCLLVGCRPNDLLENDTSAPALGTVALQMTNNMKIASNRVRLATGRVAHTLECSA
jgi:hypothetical protein